MDICCGYFRGEFYMKKVGDPNATFLPMGNVSAFAVNHEVTNVTQEDFRGLGGSACSIDYINNATLAMTLNCLKKENLAIAFQGLATALAETSVEDEEHTVIELGKLIPLNFIPKKGTVVVTDDTTPTPVTFTEGTDYIVTSAGIIPQAGGAIVVSDNLLVSYTYGLGNKIEAMTTGQQTFEIIFDGMNYGEDGTQEVVMRVFKVKFGPTATFNLLTSGEFASLEVTGTILKDTTKVGTGVSQYYNFESREVA